MDFTLQTNVNNKRLYPTDSVNTFELVTYSVSYNSVVKIYHDHGLYFESHQL